jgi:hypothetical protein
LKPATLALLAASLALTGCGKLFTAKGAIASDGGFIGTWSATPQGCSRDPLDGLPAAESSTILTFLWDDPSVRDPLRDLHRFNAPNAPMRLELWRERRGYALRLDTVKTHYTRLDPTVCSTLTVDAHESPRTIPEGRPTLSGTINLDCRVSDSRLTANINFQHCEY